jgi:putative ABC transport system ATP-binding protein
MLQMKNVSKVFITEDIETHALKSLNLHIKEGEFVSITGPSGAGKTTFLNIVGLLENFTEGEYILDGVSVNSLNDSQLSKLRNEKIGYIFQGFNLLPDLNLFDNVDVPLRYRGFNHHERKKRILEALDVVGLSNRVKHRPSQLSGGQQQRVAIARALAGKPRFLLADEPTGNLDSKMAKSVMDLLQEINKQGTTIIMVTHDLSLTAIAHRNISIHDGIATDVTPIEKNNSGGMPFSQHDIETSAEVCNV